jgi:GDP-D-mannose 3', 5'-epimerase
MMWGEETGSVAKVRVLVTGAGGFIGHHLVSHLKQRDHWVRGIDLKGPEYARTDADEFVIGDLRDPSMCMEAMAGMEHVYALAADMGGMGYISLHNADILHSNSLINLNSIEAARRQHVRRYLYTSSACIYPEFLQEDVDVRPLREEDAYPAQPQDGYGWEKLVAELACRYYRVDHGLDTRIVRFHNIFGPLGTWEGGREKAPAAMCRKVAVAKLTGDPRIEIWGDGRQTRSFCYVDDCVEGLSRLMASDFPEPINLGQDRLISVADMADLVASIADTSITKVFVDGPQGVRGRNSDNTLLREVLRWEPSVSLEDGLDRTYRWIEEQVRERLASDRASGEVAGEEFIRTE